MSCYSVGPPMVLYHFANSATCLYHLGNSAVFLYDFVASAVFPYYMVNLAIFSYHLVNIKASTGFCIMQDSCRSLNSLKCAGI